MTTTATPRLITWSDQYSVGIASIDTEHQKLVELINTLHAAMMAGTAKDAVIKTLESLASYTVTHFSREESLMQQHGFRGYANHKAEHEKLVSRLNDLRRDVRGGKLAASLDVMTFLKRWLLEHIAGSDQKYSSHLQSCGVR